MTTEEVMARLSALNLMVKNVQGAISDLWLELQESIDKDTEDQPGEHWPRKSE